MMLEHLWYEALDTCGILTLWPLNKETISAILYLRMSEIVDTDVADLT